MLKGQQPFRLIPAIVNCARSPVLKWPRLVWLSGVFDPIESASTFRPLTTTLTHSLYDSHLGCSHSLSKADAEFHSGWDPNSPENDDVVKNRKWYPRSPCVVVKHTNAECIISSSHWMMSVLFEFDQVRFRIFPLWWGRKNLSSAWLFPHDFSWLFFVPYPWGISRKKLSRLTV